jgi:succinoglycan biosynthesis protein ExoO
MARISIVLPTFNSIETIERAIGSVYAQTFTDWELIVVDDASTDNTVDYVSTQYGSDARIRILTQRTNGGPAEARNIALDHATGAWITLLDSDDAWSPHRLATLYASCEGCDFIADNIMTYDVFAKAETGPLFEDFDAEALTLVDLLRGSVGTHQVDGGYLKPMMRATFLHESRLRYNSTLRHGEDFVFYCEALCRNARFCLMNHHCYLYSTKVGRRSNRSTPTARPTPDPLALSRAIKLLRDKYSESLDPSQLESLDRFVNGLAECRWPWAFKAARKNRNYLLCLWLFACHRSVRHEVMTSLQSETGAMRALSRAK